MNVPSIATLIRPTLRSRVPGPGTRRWRLACLAMVSGRYLPLIGGPVIGIVLGIIVRNLLSPGERYQPGIANLSGKHVLQWSIIALGFGLSLGQAGRDRPRRSLSATWW